jgi:chorismate dehydratase
MAAKESVVDLERRLEHELRAGQRQRESTLENSLLPFRVGSVGYLNAVPLTRGLEEEIRFDTPSKLAEMLRRDELDAALVSIVEVLFNPRYDILDGAAIASLGEVRSVILAHTKPLSEAKEIYCDTASLTSVELLCVLLAEQGLHPQFKDLPDYDFAKLPDFTLLIGDRALDLALGPHTHQIWDLGAAWFELTGLPFVYAIWALRRGVENSSLRRQLREAYAFGQETLDHIIRTRTEYDHDFRKDYLGWHIHYHLGTDEKRGIQKFMELLRKHTARTVFEPKYV